MAAGADPVLNVADGSLSTSERLGRIEMSIREMSQEVRHLASTSDIKDVSQRLTFIERDYVPSASVTRYWRYIIAQGLVIVGLAVTVGIFIVQRLH